MAAISSASILNRSKSLPQVIKPNLAKKLLMSSTANDREDSGLSSFKEEDPELCSSIADHIDHNVAIAVVAGNEDNDDEDAEVSNNERKKSKIQGDFASGGSGMLASEPQSQADSGAHSEVAAVKQLVINTIDKKLKDLRTLKQHYYPEGGWGYVLVGVTLIVQILVHGGQLAIASFLIGASTSSPAANSRLLNAEVVGVVEVTHGLAGKSAESGWLGALSISVSLLISPLTIGLCRRKSTRLTAVFGGLITALGCLFTSFAGRFHQLFLSYGLMMGIGVGMTRDPATLMIGQYFKRRREFVEVILVSGSGLGLAAMSALMHASISAVGFRHGLQAVTALIASTFVLGAFYRSASLYHPQRRAILHLKSQKRKIKSKDKEKNRAQDDRPPYFDFSTLKSRTVQILLLAVSVASFGLFSPLLYLVRHARLEGLEAQAALTLQVYLGCGWCLGCITFGLIVVNRSRECRVSRQYLCQASLIMAGVSVLGLASAAEGYNGYVVFVWAYGASLGAFHYALKVYIYEKVRARNFSRAWGFAQCAMALPNLFGVPLIGFLCRRYGDRSGHYLAAAALLMAAIIMCLIDVHRRKLREKHKRRHRLRQLSRKSAHSVNSNLMQLENAGEGVASVGIPLEMAALAAELSSPGSAARGSHHSSHHHHHPRSVILGSSNNSEGERKLSDNDHDELLPQNPLVHQRSFTYDDFLDMQVMKAALSNGNSDCGILGPNSAGPMIMGGAADKIEQDDLTLFSEEGIADMDLPEHLFIEELDFLDNITSCNKVENCVMLSEYEQNLIKETEEPKASAGPSSSGRRWSFFNSRNNNNNNNNGDAGQSSAPRRTIGVGGVRQSSFSVDIGMPPSSVSLRGGHAKNTAGSNNSPREIPVFPNTAAWSSRLQMPSVKRSITVIDEASV